MQGHDVKKTAIVSGAAVVALATVVAGMSLEPVGPHGPEGSSAIHILWLAVIVLVALVVVGGFRYLDKRQKARLQIASQENYRQIADEYRRLADMAITAQEHTELKLDNVNESLREIWKELGR
jgi:hypothetical protein